eukprot:4106336-Alexandrium_andersonii.AAC.1
MPRVVDELQLVSAARRPDASTRICAHPSACCLAWRLPGAHLLPASCCLQDSQVRSFGGHTQPPGCLAA